MMLEIKTNSDFKQFKNNLIVFEEKGTVSYGYMHSEADPLKDGFAIENTSFRIYKFCKKHFIFSPDVWNYGVYEGRFFGKHEGRIWKSMHADLGCPRTLLIDRPLFMRKTLPHEGDTLSKEAISGIMCFFEKAVEAKIKQAFDVKLQALTKRHFGNMMFIFGRFNKDSAISALPKELVFEIIKISSH